LRLAVGSPESAARGTTPRPKPNGQCRALGDTDPGACKRCFFCRKFADREAHSGSPTAYRRDTPLSTAILSIAMRLVGTTHPQTAAAVAIAPKILERDDGGEPRSRVCPLARKRGACDDDGRAPIFGSLWHHRRRHGERAPDAGCRERQQNCRGAISRPRSRRRAGVCARVRFFSGVLLGLWMGGWR
jgi:hypothetical protein